MVTLDELWEDLERKHNRNAYTRWAYNHSLFGYNMTYYLPRIWRLPMEARYPIRWAWQRLVRGWDDRAIFAFDSWVMRHAVEVLPYIQEWPGYPPLPEFGYDWNNEDNNDEDAIRGRWIAELQDIIDGFNKGLDGDDDAAAAAADKFRKYFFHLWT